MDDVVWVMDVEGKFIYISPSVEKLRGFTPEEIQRQSFEEVICAGSRQIVIDEMALGISAAERGEEPPLRNLRVEQPCKDGSTVWTEINSRLVVDQESGEKRFIGLTRDISKTIEYEKALKKLVATDRLTGVYNRHKLDEELEKQLKLADRYGTSFGILILDIDHFKRVNDKHGHHIGDMALKAFSAILTRHSRSTDVVGRWGGEEFLVIVPHAKEDTLITFAENLRQKIARHPFEIIQHMTTSIGVARYRQSETVTELISRADKALYRSKERGRNCCHLSK
jgi:diguanylate cyclase (GGDEF)-like protein/PAS domain S-box-containing protein